MELSPLGPGLNAGPAAASPMARRFVLVILKVERGLMDAIDDAARRDRLARASFAQRVVAMAIDEDDGASALSTLWRRPARPAVFKHSPSLAIRFEKEICDRLDAIVARRAESRALFVERVLMKAVGFVPQEADAAA
jgi:hypothetical protein